MTRRNRVDPWGDLHAVAAQGMFTGNRGCLVDDAGEVVRHHRGELWITCVTKFRDWRVPLARPGRWTPIFFLDDAVALAAGHRPCGLCRRDEYRAYCDAVTRANGLAQPLTANEINQHLHAERHHPGRGLIRATDRILWEQDIELLPTGSVIVGQDGNPRLLLADRMMAFTFSGWVDPVDRPSEGPVLVMTPPTSTAALAHGYLPRMHPSAA